ncbi:hypothetical protein LN042_23100 [Kitasatospora sp. RB6PN24]|uniref:hypothetical protein n=1 Tax=Kitasatospora humi TaxID=2893891 RepID=UPI001E62F47B|nr:hypothetical protein [Kitasatospora humi]MCC9309924.1 hypothetical protein [Kitasatospora humi]
MSTPPSAGDLHALAEQAAFRLPDRYGPWRTAARRFCTPGSGSAWAATAHITDGVRTVAFMDTVHGVAVRAQPERGGSPVPATVVEHRWADARTLALAVARDQLGPLRPAPLNGGMREQQELQALDTVTRHVPPGSVGLSHSRVDRWHFVGWRTSGRTVLVRIDGPERVQIEATRLTLAELTAVLGAALAPAQPLGLTAAARFASTWLMDRHPVLWHDPVSSSTGPCKVLYGPGQGRVTVGVQVTDGPPDEQARGILTIEVDLDLALLLLPLLR